ncbi:MAG: hypothetical protein ACRERY_11120, partial [Pseudomonas sp.]
GHGLSAAFGAKVDPHQDAGMALVYLLNLGCASSRVRHRQDEAAMYGAQQAGKAAVPLGPRMGPAFVG